MKCPRPDISPYRGVSAWIPSDVASQSLDVAVSVNGVIMRKTEPPLMTSADTMAYVQCSRQHVLLGTQLGYLAGYRKC